MSNLRAYVFSFIDTVLNVIAPAVCICSTAKARFFHLLRSMCGCPNMKICRQTGNSYGLFSPNNTTGARSDTCVVTLGKTGPPMKLALCWTGTGNTNFTADTSTLITQRPHGRNKKTAFPWNHIKETTVLQKQYWRCTLTNTIDQTGQSQDLQPHVASGPSQTKARKCFVTFCGCWSRFFLWQLRSLPSVCASHPFTTCYYSHQCLEQQPPQGQLGKMYVCFARYTFGNTISL